MVCLDTSFIIDFLKKDKTAISKEINKNERITVPSPVIVELIRGLGTKHSYIEERQGIIDFINALNTLDLNKTSSIKAGDIESELRKMGEIIDIMDILIAAIAITNNETLITKNLKHFSKIPELKIESY